MELYLDFYRVFIKSQSLYSPIFIKDLILTATQLDYPMAPSPLRGAPSRREPRGTASSLPPGGSRDMTYFYFLIHQFSNRFLYILTHTSKIIIYLSICETNYINTVFF